MDCDGSKDLVEDMVTSISPNDCRRHQVGSQVVIVGIIWIDKVGNEN